MREKHVPVSMTSLVCDDNPTREPDLVRTSDWPFQPPVSTLFSPNEERNYSTQFHRVLDRLFNLAFPRKKRSHVRVYFCALIFFSRMRSLGEPVVPPPVRPAYISGKYVEGAQTSRRRFTCGAARKPPKHH